MARQELAVEEAGNTSKKPGFWTAARRSFQTSSYITDIWEWFLSLAGRLVQPVLFTTVMYNVVSTYPGFKAPWDNLNIIAFILQNGALDVGSFGLPKLADQAEADGNDEGAEKARKVAKALFYILIANLVWGGVEHVFPSIPDGVITVIGLAFVVVRAYYATEYMRTIHSLSKHAPEEAVQGQGATQRQVQISEVQAMVQGALQEVQGQIRAQIAEGQRAMVLHLQEGQGALIEGAVEALHVQGASQVQFEMQGAMQEVHAVLQTEVQGAMQEVQRLYAELMQGARVQVTEVQAHRTELVAPRRFALAPAQGAGVQSIGGASDGVQGANQEQPEKGQGARGKGATQGQSIEGQGASEEKGKGQGATTKGQQASYESKEGQQGSSEEPHTDALLLPLAPGEESDALSGYKEAVFVYMQAKIAQGVIPRVQDVMDDVGCKERTAKKYRRQALDELVPAMPK